MNERVVITGMGTINPIGKSVQSTWENVLKGTSGVGPITLFDASDLEVQIASEIKDFDPKDYMAAKEIRRRDRFEQLAIIAADEAIKHSGLVVTENEADRVGVIIASAIGGIHTTQEGVITMQDRGPRRISPMAIPMLMVNGASGMVSIEHGFQGPSLSVVSACASGPDGIGLAWLMLRAGVIDVAIAGASDATICKIAIATFDRVGAMSRRNDDYSATPQPFDLNRDGLVRQKAVQEAPEP